MAQNKFPNMDQEFLGAGGPPVARVCEKNTTKPNILCMVKVGVIEKRASYLVVYVEEQP